MSPINDIKFNNNPNPLYIIEKVKKKLLIY